MASGLDITDMTDIIEICFNYTIIFNLNRNIIFHVSVMTVKVTIKCDIFYTMSYICDEHRL